MSEDYDRAFADMVAAIRGKPRSEVDVKALGLMRRFKEDEAPAGDQAEMFLALRAFYTARLKGAQDG